MDDKTRPTKEEIEAILKPMDLPMDDDPPIIELDETSQLILIFRLIDHMNEAQLRQIELRMIIQRAKLTREKK